MSNQDEINKQHTQTISDNAQVGIAIAGDVHGGIHNYPQPRPLINPDAAQQLLNSLPLDDIPDPAPTLPAGSRILLRRNPLFVGREADLKAIAQQLKGGGAAAITTGIGGVGKTLLAVEFAHRYGHYFAGGVFWLSFADPAGIDSEIAACGGAGAIELYSDATDLTQDERVAKVQAEWALPIPRLLIFDNCDDLTGMTAEKLLAERLPRSGGCRVLVTSRRGQWRKDLGITALPLGLLSRAESITLLRSYRENLSDDDANAIAAELGDLPLALSLAGSYLDIYCDEAFGVPTVYLTNLRKQLLDHRSLNTQERSVRATFDLSYQRLDAADPTDALAIAALARAACLAPGEPFPRALLLATLGDDTDDEGISVQRADALRRLVALGLLEVAGDSALRLHRLLAAFVSDVINDAGAQAAVEQAMLDTANQLNNTGYPAPLRTLQVQLRHITDRALLCVDERAAGLANTLGYHHQMVGDLASARPYFEQALTVFREILGERHPDTATSLNNLALLLRAQGDLAGARPYFEQALAIRREVLGEKHPDTALSLNNLGTLLHAQGDLAGARFSYEQALDIYREVLDEYHPNIALSLSNLGSLLQAQGDPAGARPYLEQALAIYREVLGERHPDTAMSLNHLGFLLQEQGDLAGARPYFEQTLAIYREALGECHPNTALSLNNLGYLLHAQGDLTSARPYFRQALAICEMQLGSTHPMTVAIRRNLAFLNLSLYIPTWLYRLRSFLRRMGL